MFQRRRRKSSDTLRELRVPSEKKRHTNVGRGGTAVDGSAGLKCIRHAKFLTGSTEPCLLMAGVERAPSYRTSGEDGAGYYCTPAQIKPRRSTKHEEIRRSSWIQSVSKVHHQAGAGGSSACSRDYPQEHLGYRYDSRFSLRQNPPINSEYPWCLPAPEKRSTLIAVGDEVYPPLQHIPLAYFPAQHLRV